MKKISFLISICFFCCCFVNAQSYSTTDNLTDNNTTQIIFNLANNQISDFLYKDYIMIRNDNDYYLFSFDDDFTKSVVLHYSYNYNNSSYNIYNDNNVSISFNDLFLSNKKYNNSVTSSYYEELYNNEYFIYFFIVITGLLFAIFLNRERKYV